jgi:methionine-rich copper-binding protein CopC
MSRVTKLRAAILAAAILSACAAPPATGHKAQGVSRSILASSNPAAGSTVDSSVDTLELHFNPAARLDEIAVSGPGGTMPMMVHSVGEVAHYSLPLSGVTPGAHTVNWRATAQGTEHRGSFSFTVR